jgi:hypothetical protein
MCSRVPMSKVWVDLWSCTLVDKTPDVFWGNLVFDQVDLVLLVCDPLPLFQDGPQNLGEIMKMSMTTLRDVPHM